MNQQVPSIRVAILDVGQGDTIVVSCPDTHEAIVVDCINADAVLDYLEQEQIKYLRGVIITHLHADHYNEVDYLLERCNLVSGMSECEKLGFSMIGNTKNYHKLILDEDKHSFNLEEGTQKGRVLRHNPLQNIRRWGRSDKSKYFKPDVEGSVLPLSFKHIQGLLAENIHLLHPYAFDIPELETKGLNNTSVILRVDGPRSSALLAGDIEPAGWHILKSNYSNLQSDVLKFPHHGGAWHSPDIDDLLDTVNPTVVVLSVGSEGYEKYTHPRPEVYAALAKRPHIRILCTQATTQCQQLYPVKADDVRMQLKIQANKSGRKIIGSQRGCPCAGTVIIELGDTLEVIQPDIAFHHGSIIHSFFQAFHRCAVKTIK
jgi:beta-lactamase superfamily II metal-dependent hydrolase